ncbi:THO complex subunit 3 [Drechmeria coniospora]|uniref:THO complex subunit 3 n=1 Tax=Drechmeria coniospora TaxID=98403 RepID=A0A151GFW2_DRECN|nr:THO complex subunit 3 [Drechmeria coniospora]KYK55993.1 THO complex subunit 3 [Drechmeria coniospora]
MSIHFSAQTAILIGLAPALSGVGQPADASVLAHTIDCLEPSGNTGGNRLGGQDAARVWVNLDGRTGPGQHGVGRLTDAAAGNPEKPNVKFSTELKGHTSSVEKVAFNPVKDAELCSVSSDGVVKFWDVRTKACFNEVKGLGDALSLVWAPDGQTLLVGNKDDNVYIISPSQPNPISSHQQSVQTNQISFCWGGEKIFLATSDGRTRILTYPTFEPALHTKRGPGRETSEFKLHGQTSSCSTVELQPSSRYLATGGSDSIISLWDTKDLICQRTISGISGPVRSISESEPLAPAAILVEHWPEANRCRPRPPGFTFDGSFIVGGSDEGSGLEVYHVETGEHVHTFKTAGPSPVVAWAPLRYCLAYSDLGVLRIIGVDADRK